MTFVRHNAKIVAGPRNIDITLELTFHEYPSLAERRRMDRDHDDVIGESEVSAYLAGLADVLRDGITLAVDDRPLPVVPLYDPRVDLLGVSNVAPSHHTLRLYYFARTPAWLRAGSRIRIEDTFWSDAPRIDVLDANGTDGVRIIPDDTNNPAQSPEAATGPRVISLSCQVAPAIRPETPFVPAVADRTERSVQDRMLVATGAILLLAISAGVIACVRRCLIHHVRTGDQA
jgi:hypothetical protein